MPYWNATRKRERFRAIASLTILWLVTASCSGTSEPEGSLVGNWDLLEFSDAGVEATTTGTATFRTDGTFSIAGTVEFPGEPVDTLDVEGTYQVTGSSVDLTIGAETSTWTLEFSDDEVVLTEVASPPANTITLRRP